MVTNGAPRVKLKRGQLNRKKKGYGGRNGSASNGHHHHQPQHSVSNGGHHSQQLEPENHHSDQRKKCSAIQLLRIFLSSCGLLSILYSLSQFHFNFDQHQAPASALEQALKQQRVHMQLQPRFVRPNNSQPALLKKINPPALISKPLPPPPPPQPPRQQEHRPLLRAGGASSKKKQQQELEPPERLSDPKLFDLPKLSDSYNHTIFQQHRNGWKNYRRQIRLAKQRQAMLHAIQHPRENNNSTLQIIPHLHHQTPMFPHQRQHLSWDLMVVVMADNQCPLVSTEGYDATERLLTTLKHALKTELADVMAYLPHYFDDAQKKCHDDLFQAIVTFFPRALQSGQLQIVSSPPLLKQRGTLYQYALNGLDFAYAADLAQQHADLVLFLQAGSRMTTQWWLEHAQVIQQQHDSKENATTNNVTEEEDDGITNNRDYAREIMLSWENRQRYDEKGLSHDLCYMNFAHPATNTPPQWDSIRRYSLYENPTGALLEKAQLRRLSITLRSFLPYGRFPITTLLARYCQDLLWYSDYPDAPRLLFEYAAKGNETALIPRTDLALLTRQTTTYAYLNLDAAEVPSWVSVDASMLGPHPTGVANPVYTPFANVIPPEEQVWMTFVIPTAWRHTATGTDTKGNQYVVECLRQLSAIVQQNFRGDFSARILVLVSGRDAADIYRHRVGLEAEFQAELQHGILQLVDAPVDQYATTHGLEPHFQDPEFRVRWRSKHNMDLASAYYAAKGRGKYIMMIEDDSAFRPDKFFGGIRQKIINLHRQFNPKDANSTGVNSSPQIVVNGKAQNHKLQIAYSEGKEPAVTETGHREVWSQVRFSFGYSGVLIHDEDAFVFGMLHYLMYQEKPCDLLFEIAGSVRSGLSKDHFLRYNKKHRFIRHQGKMSTLQGKVFSDEKIAQGRRR